MGDPIQFLPVPNGDVESLRSVYLSSLVAPLDGMWEVFGQMAQSLEIRLESRLIGFCVLNDQGLILQFYVSPEDDSRASSALAALRARDDVSGAMVSTADPRFLGLCFDAQLPVRVHSILYTEHRRRATTAPNGLAGTSIAVVEAGELLEVAELQRRSLDQDPGAWLIGYLENLIARQELFTLRRGGEILATGEIRVSDSQPPYADLGVITVRRFRGQGIAGYLLSRLADRCMDRGLRPICSTTVENVASRHAIVRAGFLPHHRLLETQLE